jgi:hypothetical protein
MVICATSGSSERRYRYDVERDYPRPGFLDVALVRREVPPGRFHRRHQHGNNEGVVLFHRTFRPLLELAALETYAGQLARVAQHGNAGTLGGFVVIDSAGGTLQIGLYERWFDGQQLHVDELAQRTFDPGDDRTLVCSAEFLAAAGEWAERRDEEREAAYLEASAEDAARSQFAMERERKAEELAQILASEVGSAASVRTRGSR